MRKLYTALNCVHSVNQCSKKVQNSVQRNFYKLDLKFCPFLQLVSGFMKISIDRCIHCIVLLIHPKEMSHCNDVIKIYKFDLTSIIYI